ncbi:alpha-galactosidase [bacterium]|nr:alpha-galactosidase [bacterium]
MKRKNLIAIAIFLTVVSLNTSAQTAQECIAPTPPMGWNSWNYFGEKINEDVIRKTADAMVSSGLRDAGYRYLVIDDIWEYGRVTRFYKPEMVAREGRDADGRLLVNPEKFPSGMKAIGDYIHSKGLKFGIYTAPGEGTCYGCTGSLGYEAIDVATFAEWGVDYIKLDGCMAKEDDEVILKRWRFIIDSIGRPIVLSTNIAGPALSRKYADMWRTTTDIMPKWKHEPDEFKVMEDVFGILNLQTGNEGFHGQCRWNDPDMLQVGNGGLTYSENKAHFGMWAILGAPLILGNNLYEMKDSVRDILTNPEVITVNQDPAGVMATKIYDDGNGVQVWAKRLWKVGDIAVAILNAGNVASDIKIKLADIGITGQAFFRDAFSRKDLGLYSGTFSVSLKKNDILLARVSAFEQVKPLGAYQEKVIQFGTKPIRIEAENSKYYVARTSQSEYPEYSGKGYLISQNNDWASLQCTWDFGIAKEGSYKISIRYINFSDSTLEYKVYENHTDEQRITLPPSRENHDWQSLSFNVELKKGNNRFKINSPNSKANSVAFDYIEIEENK